AADGGPAATPVQSEAPLRGAIAIRMAIPYLEAPPCPMFGQAAKRLHHSRRRGRKMPKKRVFVSFDFDNDKVLKDFIIGQARLPDSPFDVTDTSLKEAQPMKTWEDKARAAIRRSDLVLVMVGPETHRAPGVLKEVAIA